MKPSTTQGAAVAFGQDRRRRWQGAVTGFGDDDGVRGLGYVDSGEAGLGTGSGMWLIWFHGLGLMLCEG
ncbi:hypothetical protein M0R45_009027 [Rubus argutus]|uniref:Uncharacterized protein n=1 Tax=Rubus argutus TaxID=59490 RepID=A0AAW1Y3B7_RUBAR